MNWGNQKGNSQATSMRCNRPKIMLLANQYFLLYRDTAQRTLKARLAPRGTYQRFSALPDVSLRIYSKRNSHLKLVFKINSHSNVFEFKCVQLYHQIVFKLEFPTLAGPQLVQLPLRSPSSSCHHTSRRGSKCLRSTTSSYSCTQELRC